MTYPPVRSLRLLDLPVRNRANFGAWMNAAWDESAAVAVLGAEPYTWIDSEARCGFRRLRAEARDGLRLRGAKAALVAGETVDPCKGRPVISPMIAASTPRCR